MEEGIEMLNSYKTGKPNARLLEGSFLRDQSKQIKDNIIESYPQIIDIGCECIIGIQLMSFQGDVFNPSTMRVALSIFALDLFITAIDADGFDKLNGKWPFSMYNSFEVGESSNTQQGGGGSASIGSGHTHEGDSGFEFHERGFYDNNRNWLYYRGYYDSNGQWHDYEHGYYDNHGNWHNYDQGNVDKDDNESDNGGDGGSVAGGSGHTNVGGPVPVTRGRFEQYGFYDDNDNFHHFYGYFDSNEQWHNYEHGYYYDAHGNWRNVNQ